MLRRYKQIRITGVFLLVWLFAFNADARNRIKLEVDKTRLALGDILRVTVTATLDAPDDVDDLIQTDFKGFKVINSNTGTQHQTSIINLKVESKKIITTVTDLQPLELGVFTVGPAAFRERGRLVESNRAQVTVVNLKAEIGERFYGNQAISAAPTEAELESAGVFLRLIPERGELYEGEQMAVTLYIYSANISVSRWGRVASPTFSGFLSEQLELSDKSKVRSVVLNRRPHHVEALDSFLLTAREVGSHVITPYQAKVMVGDSNFFGGRWVGRRSAPIEITIKPLPEEGRPPGFTSANVGRFSLTARIDRRTTEVGQPVALTLMLKGNVDMSRVSLPRLPKIRGAKVYPPTESSENYQNGLRIAGKRKAEYLVVPTGRGNFTIPSVTFQYFDTETGAYRTIKTRAYNITAVKGNGRAGGAGLGKQELMLEEGALRPLHATAALERMDGRFYGSKGFLVLFWGPLGLFLLLLASDLRRWAWPRLFGSEKARLERRARALAAELELRAGAPDEAFLADLKYFVYLEIQRAYGEVLSGLTHEQLDERLSVAGADDDIRREAVAILEACDLARYANAEASGDAGELLSRSKAFSKRLH